MITEDMEIEEIISQYPQTIQPMSEMGIQCILCGEPVWGTLREKAFEKNLSNLPEIVRKLNEIISKQTK